MIDGQMQRAWRLAPRARFDWQRLVKLGLRRVRQFGHGLRVAVSEVRIVERHYNRTHGIRRQRPRRVRIAPRLDDKAVLRIKIGHFRLVKAAVEAAYPKLRGGATWFASEAKAHAPEED